MTARRLRLWFLIHKWTSIVCTAFLLMLCVTGLPLIFHDEIDAITKKAVSPQNGAGSSSIDPRLLPLDTMLAKALAARPESEVPMFMAFDNHLPLMTITTGPAPNAPAAAMTMQTLDRMTGAIVTERAKGTRGVMRFILQLHTDMFLGLPGMLFLGAMGLLFTAALVSGVVLYAPFMRRLKFGTVRATRSRRVKWLDYHNLLGAVSLAWMAVVGLTGIINTLADPIRSYWQATELADMTRTYAGKEAVPPQRYGSLDAAMATARAAVPGYNPQFIAFPGGGFSSRNHYAIFFQGETPLTERLLTPALIDAENGSLTAVRSMPWYTKALSLSQPLHFGDYGGLPLKILWALLTLFTIFVISSGLYLWLARNHGRRSTDAAVREIETGAAFSTTAAE